MKFEALVAFERSGQVRRALRARGIDAWSCDLVPADDGSPYHITGDARVVMLGGGRLLIAHPPCTRLTLAGVRWLHERDLWDDLDEACAMFRACLDAPFAHVAVENPTPHGHAVKRIGRTYDAVTQPWEHGHGETKRTCWWLKDLSPLLPSNIVEGREGRVWKLPPGKDRARLRSETLPGMAAAIADQWGAFATRQLEAAE